jgi:hypothetical protein
MKNLFGGKIGLLLLLLLFLVVLLLVGLWLPCGWI